MPIDVLAVLLGLALGAVVGATVLLTNFCALGAVADIIFAKDWRRMRAWLLAAGIALIGTQALDATGIIDLDGSYFLSTRITWAAALMGGICFGFGMALAGGCVNRTLVRTGAGSLKSLVTVLVVGLFAAMTASGVVAPIAGFLDHAGTITVSTPSGIHRLIAAMSSADPDIVRWAVTTLLGGGLILFSLRDSWFRRSRDHVVAGFVIGTTLTAAWAVTGTLTARAGQSGAEAINFVAPLGELLLAVTSSAAPALFSSAIVLGVPIGAFVTGLATRNLGVEGFTETSDLARHLVGGALMGFGGTLALGCTFGQGLSGFSALSVSALIAIAGIWFGCLWGIRTFEAEGLWAGLALTFRRRMN